MSLVLTMDMIRQGNTCDPAIAEMEKYFIENNITEVSFDEIIAYWKKINRRDWAIWVYQNKKVFEAISAYTPTAEEQLADEKTLQDLNKLDFVSYVVNGVEYETLEEATNASNSAILLLKDEMEKTVVCNLEEKHENGDATWTTVDLDDLQLTENCVIKVFNPSLGQYTTHTSLEDALEQRNKLIAELLDIADNCYAIGRKVKQKDFPDEVIVFYEI